MTLIPYGLDETTKEGRPANAGEGLVGADGTPLDIFDAAAHAVEEHGGLPGVGRMVQRGRVAFTAKLAVAGSIPVDGSIPQITEGQFVVSIGIIPKKIGNKILVRAHICWSGLNNSNCYTAALFEAGNVSAIGATPQTRGTGTDLMQDPIYVEGELTTVSLDTLTFSVRFGPRLTGGSPFINADNTGSHNHIFGAAISTFLEIQEFDS